MDLFSWIPIYKEIASKVTEFRSNQAGLLALIRRMKDQGIPTISMEDTDSDGNRMPLSEIDPFTFFSNFNRGITRDNRIAMIALLKETWGLKSQLPADFSGIPLSNNQRSWFISYQNKRGKNDTSVLWKIFLEAVEGEIQEETFNSALAVRMINWNLTMGLFWVAPDRYLNLDSVNRAHLKKNNVLVPKELDYESYQTCLESVKRVFEKPFYVISREAWANVDVEEIEEDPTNDGELREESVTRFWLCAPGRGGEHWEEFYEKGIVAIGWDYLGDMRQYTSKEEIAERIREHDNDPDSSKKNNSTACFSMAKKIKPGDIIFAKTGTSRIVGWGRVTSDYFFDDTRKSFKHVRKVDWQAKGDWVVSDNNKFALKTLTDVTRYPDFTDYLKRLISNTDPNIDTSMKVAEPEGYVQYWWLNSNPKIWDITGAAINSRQTYTSHNSQGNKRRVYQYFTMVKPGDLILGYVSSPMRRIVALCKVTKGLHQSERGEAFEFEKVEQFPEGVTLKTLQSIPDLEKCEPLINNQGSLFKLKPDEYDIIRSILDETNEEVVVKGSTSPLFSIEECSAKTGYPTEKIKKWVGAIERKKQAVFFGPPGTGKTYLAGHLAEHLIGGSDGFTECIQFHPAYTYEEFMQGIRPETDEKGLLQFDLKPGRFLDFCSRARLRKGNCVLIIDELNRANLSRVFGELMYLLEYREKAMSLAAGERFSIPNNVFVIGTMNTADRSIALVDFALRRRFAFLELAPEYGVLERFQTKNGFNSRGLIKVIQSVNEKIADKNYHLGISFFMEEKLPLVLEDIWTLEIETYLEEYFFSQPEVLEGFRWNSIKEKVLS